MVNKKLHLVCRQELSAVTSAAHSTSHDGFSAAIEFGRVNAGLRGRVDAVLARTAAELPAGGDRLKEYPRAIPLLATALKDYEITEQKAKAIDIMHRLRKVDPSLKRPEPQQLCEIPSRKAK